MFPIKFCDRLHWLTFEFRTNLVHLWVVTPVYCVLDFVGIATFNLLIFSWDFFVTFPITVIEHMKEVTEGTKDLSCFAVVRGSIPKYSKEGIVAGAAHSYGEGSEGLRQRVGILQEQGLIIIKTCPQLPTVSSEAPPNKTTKSSSKGTTTIWLPSNQMHEPVGTFHAVFMHLCLCFLCLLASLPTLSIS